ncbi:hypothetical protein BGX30_007202 [Mortierella sp. GBA39]|nr:hypothetical protein BGX30_007202 [Mortierella sp. GBA39]
MLKTSFIAMAAAACLAILSYTPMTEAHVGLRSPCPRYGSFAGCPAPPKGQSVDYDLNSPIGTHDTIGSPICKHTVPASKRQTFKAGQTIKTEYSIGASHGGGHCQYALSYDKGKTWVVIKTVLRDCLKGTVSTSKYSVSVKIPDSAPSGDAVFMWLWNNAVGNRELYSNCVDIKINGKNGGQIKGLVPLIANYGPKSPLIGEFPNANQPDGSNLFAKRKSITVNVAKAK